MKRPPASRHDLSGAADETTGFWEELRESFTDNFAYDLFSWAMRPGDSQVTFSPLAARTAGGNGGDGSGSDDGQPAAIFTNADIPVYTTGSVVPIDGSGAFTPQSNVSGPLVAVDDFRADQRFAGIDGSGQTIAILDTGIDVNDSFFGPDLNGDNVSDRIVYQYDFADNDGYAGDKDGHGSNVASIAASSHSKYTGMAPGANIAALKVFSDTGESNFAYIEEALQWVIANAAAYNIVSVNMSLSDGGNYNTPAQLYDIADEMATLAAMNVVVVSASGNDFYEFNSVQGVAYPAADPNSLSVGAVYDGNTGGWRYQGGATAHSTVDDQIVPFSQRDDQLTDIFAPGAPITGAHAGSGLLTMHGTSQAAPHISGIIALAQELAVQELGRKLTFDEIANLLKTTGDTIVDGDDEDDNVTNTGQAFQRVNVLALGEAILAMADGPPRDPTYFEVAATDAVKTEGDSASTSFTFTVTRSGDLSAADTIDYSVSGRGASAAEGGDFSGGSLPSGSVTFAIGETTSTVTIQVLGDSIIEADEGFTLTISGPPPNGEIVTAQAQATIVNDDSTAGGVLEVVNADFDESGDTEGFTYVDGAFGGALSQPYASGVWEGQALTIELGGINSVNTTNISGGWQFSFNLSVESEVDLSFLYNLFMSTYYEANETTRVLFRVDGGTPIVVDQMTGNGNGGPHDTTGDVIYNGSLGVLSAGSHTIAIGGLNTLRTTYNEYSTITIDDVRITAEAVDPPPSFAIAATDAVKAEGDNGSTAFTFTVTRSGDTSAAGTVNYMVSGGGSNATALDFQGGSLPSGTLSFLAGDTSKTLTVNVAGDTNFEGDENFTVTLLNPSNGAQITIATAQGTIQNDEPVPSVFNVAALDAEKAEGDSGTTDFTFTVSRNETAEGPASVNYQVGGFLADGTDFAGGVLPSGTLNFAAGEFSKTVVVQVAGDTDYEGDESFSLSLQNPSQGAGIGTSFANGSIFGDDPQPAATWFTIGWMSPGHAEGDSGDRAFTFVVNPHGDLSQSTWVDYVVIGVGDNPADASDFGGSFPSGRLEFSPNQDFQHLTINVSGDVEIEGDERFAVVLTNSSPGTAITTASTENVINDDDAPAATQYEIGALDAAKAEGDSDVTNFTFAISRSGDLSSPATISYRLAGTGTNPADGTDFAGGLFVLKTATFAAGESSVTVNIRVAGDSNFEADEEFVVTIFDPTNGGEVASGSDTATGTIVNDDPVPLTGSFSISASDAVKTEGDSGSTALVFTVSRSGDASSSASVDYAVTSGGAGDSDFVGGVRPSGTVVFAAGESSKTISLQVQGDSDIEPDESFIVTLTNPSSGSDITTATAVGTILNDDNGPPTSFLWIQATDTTLEEGDAGITAFTFTVVRQGDFHPAGSVDYHVTGVSADGEDFAGGVLPTGTIDFAFGETSKTITIEVSGDTELEGNETFQVTLTNPSAGLDVSLDTGTGTILNDEAPPPGESIAVLEADFDTGSGGMDGFNYFDGALGIAANTNYVHGNWTGDELRVWMGGVNDVEVDGASGGWQESFHLSDAMEVTLSFDYRMLHAGAFESDEYAQILFSIDGGPVGIVTQVNGVSSSTEDVVVDSTTYQVSLGVLEAGDHTLTLGGFLNHKDSASELSEVFFDNVLVSATTPDPTIAFLAIAPDDAEQSEGDLLSPGLTFTVTRSGNTSSAGTVDYAVTGGSADAADFAGGVLPSGTVSFLAGETSKAVTVPLYDDFTGESDETLIVTLSNPSAGSSIITASAQGTILDDDGPPTDSFLSISAADAVKSEGDDGTTLFTFLVSRPGTIIDSATVDYSVVGSGSNPAEAGDFVGGVLPSGSVTIQGEGASGATITIEVAGDGSFEEDETFTVVLSNPSAGAEIVTGSAQGTIQNDDAAGPFVLVDADFNATGDTEGFVYQEGVFGGASPQPYADGAWDGQALSIELGGINSNNISNMSGGWVVDFDLAAETDVSLSFLYNLTMTTFYEANETTQVLFSLDGGAPVIIDSITGNGNGGPHDTTGNETFEVDLGTLAAGSHSITIGGLNTLKTTYNEVSTLTIDDVLITGTSPGSSSATPEDVFAAPAAGSVDSLLAGIAESELQSIAGV